MRLVDMQAVVDTIYRMADRIDTGDIIDYRDVLAECVKGLPAVDAVPVVRCKDCKKYRPIFKQALPLLGTCDICGIMRETDYCSMGAGREE